MSKGLHFAYTSHGKSLTITLLTYTLTRSKRIFFSFTKRQENTGVSWKITMETSPVY